MLAAVATTGALAAGTTTSGGKSAKASAETAPPAEIQALLNLLADPKVQDWLKQQHATEVAPAAAKPMDESPAEMMSSRVEAVRTHLADMVGAMPALPAEYTRAAGVFRERLGDRRPARILTLLLAFVALGFGIEGLFSRATRRIRQNLEEHPVDTVGDRVRLVAERSAFAFGSVVAYAIGSIGAFLVFHWPGLLRQVVLGYLIVFLAIRIAAVLGRFMLAPYNERFRVIPMVSAAARYWYLRLRLIVGWLVLAMVTRGLLEALGISPAAVNLIGAGIGLCWVLILLEAVWRRPLAGGDAAGPEITPEARRLRGIKVNAALTVGLVLLWGLRVAGMMPAFWLLAVVILWPLIDRVTRRAVEHLLRPPGTVEVAGLPSLSAVLLERGLRALFIIVALAVLAWGWGIDMESLAGRETMMTRVAHGALSAVLILLIADFVWHVTRAAIDLKLAETADPGVPNTDEARRRARLRTLLPIFRNVLFVIVVVVAVMMALAAMGVEIGPLIAGAGVIGVAIGFGAQSLVRDVIAGVFYLLDDAFRVGEYIQSGNYKGTVESFSFRSVRLRHQRGALYTVPFALLGAVQNQSRDWVIDKLTVGITYDSDIDKARKLIKQIGLELAEEPDFKPLILQPLKMQGVDAFGDYAVQIRMKMMTLPGENFVIRRQALAMIKKAFDANGIKFAFPTVQLAGDGEPTTLANAAIAQQALQLTHPQQQAAE